MCRTFCSASGPTGSSHMHWSSLEKHLLDCMTTTGERPRTHFRGLPSLTPVFTALGAETAQVEGVASGLMQSPGPDSIMEARWPIAQLTFKPSSQKSRPWRCGSWNYQAGEQKILTRCDPRGDISCLFEMRYFRAAHSGNGEIPVGQPWHSWAAR